MFETEKQKRTIQRWSRLAIQFNGAAQSGHFEHITTGVVAAELEHGQLFEFLERELPATVWKISKLSDVDRHELAREWTVMTKAYVPDPTAAASLGAAAGERETLDRT